MKRVLIVLVITVLSVFLVGSTAAQDSSARTITVTGFGEAFGAPDQAYIQLGVESVGSDAAATFAEVNSKLEIVLEALRNVGITPEDMQTTGLYIYQESRYEPSLSESATAPSYRVGNNLNVTIRDISQVGAVINAAVTAGANSVNSLNFSLSDSSSLESSARAAAVSDARTRAEQLAQLLGVSLGDVVTVVEGSSDSQPMFFDRAQSAGGGVPVQEGQISVGMSIRVTFAIN